MTENIGSYDIISRDIIILSRYMTRKKVDSRDSQQIDELAQVGLITKKLDLTTFEMTAQISPLGKELLGKLIHSHENSKNSDSRTPEDRRKPVQGVMSAITVAISGIGSSILAFMNTL